MEIEAKLNEFNQTQIAEQASDAESLEGVVRTDITSYGRDKIEGSQYRFKTWYTTGSSTINFASDGIETNDKGFALIDSIGEDYWNPIQPQLTGSRVSEVFTDNNFHKDFPGDTDIFRGALSFTDLTSRVIFTGSVAGYSNSSLYNNYGFRFNIANLTASNYFEINPTGSYFNYTSSTSNYVIPSASGLFFQGVASDTQALWDTYIKVPAFTEYDTINGSDAEYEISFNIDMYLDNVNPTASGDYTKVAVSTREWPAPFFTGSGIYYNAMPNSAFPSLDITAPTIGQWEFVQKKF